MFNIQSCTTQVASLGPSDLCNVQNCKCIANRLYYYFQLYAFNKPNDCLTGLGHVNCL
jgi:hypothetical protein